MDFTSKDFEQTEQVARIVQLCDKTDIEELERIVDEIYKYQPFVISIFLGYKDDMNPYQHDEILRVLIIIWLFFKSNKNVERRKINVALFEKKQQKNVQFLQYLSGEPSNEAQLLTTGLNLGQLKSKALFTAVLFKIREGKTLKNLEQRTSNIILIGMKSLIEAFEHVK
ncbi:MAG: hypothetical protein AB8G86_04155 [Saprospiraceae bacterium]